MLNQKLERELFTNMQKQFSKNDFIKINPLTVPKNYSNNLNRFYNNDYSLWFARLKKSENEKLYYFGLKYDENEKSNEISPRLILRSSNENKYSSIRFIDNTVYAVIKVDKKSNAFYKLNKLFRLKSTTKNKKLGIYFLDLGRLNSKQIIKNISNLIVNFEFKLNPNTNVLKITKVLEHAIEAEFIVNDNVLIKNPYNVTFDDLKFNFKVIEFKNNLKNKNLNDTEEKKINKYLFSKNTHDNFCFNDDFKKSFSKPKYELFDLLNEVILKLSENSTFDDFLEIVNS